MKNAIKTLAQAVDKLKWDIAKLENDLVESKHTNKSLQAEISRYRKVLEHYAGLDQPYCSIGLNAEIALKAGSSDVVGLYAASSMEKSSEYSRLMNQIENFKAENARYREALQKIYLPDPVQYDGEMALAYKMIAREALKGRE